MRLNRFVGIAAAIALIVSCFFPWVIIESRNMSVTGVDTTGTNFGKPAFIHFILTAVFLFFHLTPRVWAKRGNLIVSALNFAWAIRNYFIISACRGGECPVKEVAIFVALAAALIMLIAALFPDIELSEKPK